MPITKSMAKHLYIIGNGFDIYSGLQTKYSDFEEWLKNNYAIVYESLESTYNFPDIEWWNDFEVSLGKLNIEQYVINNISPTKTKEELIKKIEERPKRNANIPISFIRSSSCAKRLSGLFDLVHYCMKKWVESMNSINGYKRIHLETEDSFFLNFNYTKTLEWLYNIPKEQILHIHGCAFESEKFIFGHNTSTNGQNFSYDEEKVCDVLGNYYKNPYLYISQHTNFFESLKDVNYIHIYGLSFSPVDIDYLDWIFNNTSNEVEWEVSWYNDKDKSQINDFVKEHWNIKNRLKLMQLNSE